MSDLIDRLKQRKVTKRSAKVSLEGRVLYLVDDADGPADEFWHAVVGFCALT